MPTSNSFDERFAKTVQDFSSRLKEEQKKKKLPFDSLREIVLKKLLTFNRNLQTWVFQSEAFGKYLKSLFDENKRCVYLNDRMPLLFLRDCEIVYELSFPKDMDNQAYLCLEKFFDETTFEKFCELLFRKFGPPINF